MAKIAKTADRKKVMDTSKSTACPKCGKDTRIVKRTKDRERGVQGRLVADSQWLVASRISKKGATESRLFRCINSSGISRTCGLTPATLCAVPTGLTFFGQRTQGLRPGLISSAPSGWIWRSFWKSTTFQELWIARQKRMPQLARIRAQRSAHAGFHIYSFCNEVCVLCSRVTTPK